MLLGAGGVRVNLPEPLPPKGHPPSNRDSSYGRGVRLRAWHSDRTRIGSGFCPMQLAKQALVGTRPLFAVTSLLAVPG